MLLVYIVALCTLTFGVRWIWVSTPRLVVGWRIVLAGFQTLVVVLGTATAYLHVGEAARICFVATLCSLLAFAILSLSLRDKIEF